MILQPGPPLVKPDEAALRGHAHPDARVDAFARLIEASDRADVKSTVAAVRELRGLGWSVCPVTSARKGGR